MKKLILGMIIGVSFTALVGAGIASYSVSKKTAEVTYRSGLYIYTDSKPVMEYEHLGNVTYKLTMSGKYHEIIPALIKKAKKDYPGAEGIIYTSGESCEVIKFK